MKQKERNPKEYTGVWVFTEIQDHERVLEASLEILSKARELADSLAEPLTAVVLALEAERYLPDIAKYGPDRILFCSHQSLKHYHGTIFPDLVGGLIERHRPSIVLFPSSEAGRDLAPRLAQRMHTGITAHCTGLEIVDSEEHGERLLLMKRPAFSGNMIAGILCPSARPQMATVQAGVFERREPSVKKEPEIETFEFNFNMETIREKNLGAPKRWDRRHIPIEKSPVIVAGGRGMGSKQNFDKLYDLSEVLGGEVGATRVPVFNGWCPEERMIGQTGRSVHPRLYLGFGISGQIQHTSSIVDSDVIVTVNMSPDVPLAGMSDYVIQEDAARFACRLIERIKAARRTFNNDGE